MTPFVTAGVEPPLTGMRAAMSRRAFAAAAVACVEVPGYRMLLRVR
jgi:hypothetical protein